MTSTQSRSMLAVVVLAALLGTQSHAEVIELEGTVKAVDADARTISIERKTAKGTKTLELEVNKKAGDLSAVNVGDKISLIGPDKTYPGQMPQRIATR